MLTNVDFVNIYGQPVTLVPQPIKRTQSRRTEDQHLGFVVTGFSPEHLLSAASKHRATQEELLREKKPAPNWSEAAYMKKAKAPRVRPKPYEVLSAAEEVADLCRRAGWQRVSVEPLIRKANA